MKLFVIFPSFPFNMCGICSDVTPIIPDTSNFFFFLISLARSSILFIFSKSQIFVSLTSIVSVFYFIYLIFIEI